MTLTELLDTIRKEIERLKNSALYDDGEAEYGYKRACKDLLSFLDTLQEPEVDLKEEIERRIMKDYPYVPGWRQNKENNKPAIKRSVLMFTTHGVAEGEWDGEQWVQYRWSCKVKDSDVLYWLHLADLQTLEKEGESVQEPEVEGLEEEARKYLMNNFTPPGDKESFLIEDAAYTLWFDDVCHLARHFAEWGAKNAK